VELFLQFLHFAFKKLKGCWVFKLILARHFGVNFIHLSVNCLDEVHSRLVIGRWSEAASRLWRVIDCFVSNSETL